ncbi:2Fe-2S iron-sulfur cluster-binding protein [Chloroflexota bacterium]
MRTLNTKSGNKTVKLTVLRFNPETDKEPRYETYETEWVPTLTAHMALTYINKHSRANIAFRRGCKESTCGACAISANGVPALACRMLVRDGDVLEPLKGYPLIRDLVIDRTGLTTKMFRKTRYGREGEPIGFIAAKPEQISVSRGLTICIDCHGCNSICPPLLETPEEFVGPMYLVNIIRSMFNPLEEYDRVTQAVDMGLYNCTMCQACTFSCPKEIGISESIILARQRAVRADVIPAEVRKIRRNILEKGSVSGISNEKRTSWVADSGITKSGKTLFFASCEYSATEEGRRVLTLAMELLKKAGISLSYLYEEEPCCGGPLYFYGFDEDFKQKAVNTHKTLVDKGVEEIITHSALCAYTFKELYPEYIDDFNIRTKTVFEIILEKIKSGEIHLKTSGSQKVVFHDPPFLSRFLGIVEEPREILANIPGVMVVEPRYYWGFNTMGDGNMGVNKRISSKIARARLKQLAASGAGTIVTASVSDLYGLKRAAKTLGNQDIEIVDIIEFVARALEA